MDAGAHRGAVLRGLNQLEPDPADAVLRQRQVPEHAVADALPFSLHVQHLDHLQTPGVVYRDFADEAADLFIGMKRCCGQEDEEKGGEDTEQNPRAEILRPAIFRAQPRAWVHIRNLSVSVARTHKGDG